MSENATESTESAQTQDDQQNDQQVEQDTTDWKAEARKWEARAKENKGAAATAEKARLAAMSESERAIEEARQSARAEATTAYGKRLAQSELRAIAADSGAKLPALEYLDLGRFVGDDGEPDTKTIKAFVESLEKKDPGPPSLDGGARSTAKATDMNQVLRAAMGRA